MHVYILYICIYIYMYIYCMRFANLPRPLEALWDRLVLSGSAGGVWGPLGDLQGPSEGPQGTSGDSPGILQGPPGSPQGPSGTLQGLTWDPPGTSRDLSGIRRRPLKRFPGATQRRSEDNGEETFVPAMA